MTKKLTNKKTAKKEQKKVVKRVVKQEVVEPVPAIVEYKVEEPVVVEYKELTLLSKLVDKFLRLLKLRIDWDKAPAYIERRGVLYEKIFDNTVNVDFDLDNDVLEKIKTESRNGMYVSEQDFIRTALREMVQNRW